MSLELEFSTEIEDCACCGSGLPLPDGDCSEFPSCVALSLNLVFPEFDNGDGYGFRSPVPTSFPTGSEVLNVEFTLGAGYECCEYYYEGDDIFLCNVNYPAPGDAPDGTPGVAFDAYLALQAAPLSICEGNLGFTLTLQYHMGSNLSGGVSLTGGSVDSPLGSYGTDEPDQIPPASPGGREFWTAANYQDITVENCPS